MTLESLNSKYASQQYKQVIEEIESLPASVVHQLKYTQLLMRSYGKLKADKKAKLFLKNHPLDDWKTQNIAAHFFFKIKDEALLSNLVSKLLENKLTPPIVKLTHNENLAILQRNWMTALENNTLTLVQYQNDPIPSKVLMKGIEYGIRLLDTATLVERIRMAENEPSFDVSPDEILHIATDTGEECFYHLAAALIKLNITHCLSENAVAILNSSLANIPRPKLIELKNTHPEVEGLQTIKPNIKRRMGVTFTAHDFEAWSPRGRIKLLIEKSHWSAAKQILLDENIAPAERKALSNMLQELEGGRSNRAELSVDNLSVYKSERATDNVVVCFSGINGSFFGLTDIVFDQLLSQFDCHRIYIKDTERALHLNGFGNISSFEEAGGYIQTIVAKELNVTTPCINVLTTSAGGLAGFQYAQIWKAQAVIAFSPPISVFSEFENRGKAVIKRLTKTFPKKRLDFTHFMEKKLTKYAPLIFFIQPSIQLTISTQLDSISF